MGGEREGKAFLGRGGGEGGKQMVHPTALEEE